MLAAGSSRPLLVRCERQPPGAGEVDVVLKLRDPQVSTALPWHLCLARELVASILARRAGLSVPDYAIVTITAPFVDAVQRSSEGSRLAANLGPNFGSVIVTPVLEQGARDAAMWAGPLTFDALLLNGDRKAGNRNALFDGTQLYLIDHSLAAPTWQLDERGEPDTTLFGTRQITAHAGFEFLRGRSADYPGWSQVCVEPLDETFLCWLAGQIPEEWLPDAEVNRLVTFLRTRRGVSDEQADELRTVVR